MSLLSPEHYIAVLGGGAVGLCRRRRDGLIWLGRLDTGAEPGDWPAASTALARLLAEQVPGRARLSVVLSAHFTRYCLVPWSAEIRTPGELETYGRLCVEELYGQPAAGWSLRLSPDIAGRPRLAAAMPAALLERLRQAAEAASIRLLSVQPYLMSVVNRFCASLSGNDFLFILAEPGRSTLLRARDGHWAGVRSLGAEDSDPALGALIERELTLEELDGTAADELYLHAPGRAGERPRPACARQPRLLELPRPQVGGDPLYTMAQTVN